LLFADSALSAVKYLDLRNRWQDLFEQEMPWVDPQGTPCRDSFQRFARQAAEWRAETPMRESPTPPQEHRCVHEHDGEVC
jgi:hypothetical protein